MKKYYLILIQVALSIFLISSAGFGAPNINGFNGSFNTGEWTIDNTNTPYSSVTIGGTRGNPRHENANANFTAKTNQFYVNGDYVGKKGYVGPGYGGQKFDAEYLGLFIDDHYLYFGLQTGFNLKDGEDCGSSSNKEHYSAGDIAIDFSKDLSTNPDFEFGIDLDNISENGTSGAGTSLWAVNSWTQPTPYTNSAPFQIAEVNGTNDGSLITFATTNNAWSKMTTEEKNNVDYFAKYSGHGKNSDVFEGKIKLSLLQETLSNININLNGTSSYYATIHWTMSCGNDYLNKTIKYNSPVPEPATILLFGMGLLGAGTLVRKKMSSKKA